MPSMKELAEERTKLLADLEKKLEVAKSEVRKFSDDENKSIEDTKSKVAELDQKIADLGKVEESLAEVRGLQQSAPKILTESRTQTGSIEEPPSEKRNRIPANVIQRRHVKGFEGPDANYRAYRAGQWALAALFGREDARNWCKDHGIELRAQSSNNNYLGGYAIVPEFSTAIIDLREQYGVFRRESRVVPMNSDTLLIPRRDGGLTAYFVSENSTITDSDKTWSQVQLTAKKLATLTRWPSELNDDAVISIASDLASEIAWSFALKEDQCGFLGDGTSTYGGVFGLVPKIDDGTHTASIATTDTGDTAFSSLDLDDFHRAVGLLPLYARANAKWYISSAGFSGSMERLSYSVGGNTKADISGGSSLSFLGYPVVLSQVMNSTLTTQTSTVLALFGDLRLAATFGDRSGVMVETSKDRYFELDQLAIRGIERFDINCHDLGTTSVAGPMVAIKTAGS